MSVDLNFFFVLTPETFYRSGVRRRENWYLEAKGVVGELCVFGALVISGSHKPQVFRSINCQLIM